MHVVPLCNEKKTPNMCFIALHNMQLGFACILFNKLVYLCTDEKISHSSHFTMNTILVPLCNEEMLSIT